MATVKSAHASHERILPFVAAAFCVLFVVCLLAATKNPIALDDGLRHFAMAKVLSIEGLSGAGWNQFLYHGFFSMTSFDPWLIPELLMIPLTGFAAGAALKIFAALQFVILLGSFWILLRTLKVSLRASALLMLLLGLGEVTVAERLLLGRPFPLAVALGLLSVAAILRERFILLTIILAAAAFLSHLFLFSLFFVCAGAVWFFVTRRKSRALVCVSAGILGVSLGILLHPEPTMYIQYLVTIFWRIPFLQHLHLGNELKNGFLGDIRTIVSAVGIEALLISIIQASRPRWQEQKLRDASFFFIPIVTLFIGTLTWARTIDLFWPVLLAGIGALVAADPTALPRLSKKMLPARMPRLLPLLAVLLYIGVQAGTVAVHIVERDAKRSLRPFVALEEIPAGSKVLNVDWDLFPIYVLLRPDLTYATGMDPSFTYLTDKEVSKHLEMLWSVPFKTEGLVNADTWLSELRKKVPGDVLLLDSERHKVFIQSLKQEKLQVLSETGALAIFHIK